MKRIFVRRSKSVAIAAFAALSLSVGQSEARSITYQQILAAPDDVELNFAYARQEARTGRLQQSAAALERILLAQPNNDSARLFYGVVLYRLNDLKGAVRELTLLLDRDLTPRQERDRDRYLDLAQKQDKLWRFSARYTLGGRFDTNPGRFSESALAVGLAEEESDGAAVGISRFRVERSLENGRGDFAFLETNTRINEFIDTDTADYITSRSKLGATFHGARLSVSPFGYYSTSFLQHERFRNRYGGGVDTVLSLNSQVDLLLYGFAAYEDYRRTDFSTIGDLRDGWYGTVRAGVKWKATDRQIFRLYGRIAEKDARDDGYDYTSYGIRASSVSLLGEGRYVTLTAAYTRNDFDEPDNRLSRTVAREDNRLYLRASAGAPLETLFKSSDIDVPEFLADVVAQVGVTYSTQNSSIPLLEYSNFSVDLLFTKRVTF
ncbi:MAG: surface lipoprotein assembly modifier [Ahrensia sp.]|nr:surface lipoprotein assembly modifier [Ahrensia sp.]